MTRAPHCWLCSVCLHCHTRMMRREACSQHCPSGPCECRYGCIPFYSPFSCCHRDPTLLSSSLSSPSISLLISHSSRLWDQGLSASVGVTTGVVFCGVVGATMRKEYTVLGDTVNLSARLMQYACNNGGGVVCDQQVRGHMGTPSYGV